MIHQGLGGGSSSPQQSSSAPLTGWQQMHQNISQVSGNPLGGLMNIWNPTTSYDTVDQWRQQTGSGLLDLPGLGVGGMPEGFRWDKPVTVPGSQFGSQAGSLESIAFILLGLM